MGQLGYLHPIVEYLLYLLLFLDELRHRKPVVYLTLSVVVVLWSQLIKNTKVVLPKCNHVQETRVWGSLLYL